MDKLGSFNTNAEDLFDHPVRWIAYRLVEYGLVAVAVGVAFVIGAFVYSMFL